LPPFIDDLIKKLESNAEVGLVEEALTLLIGYQKTSLRAYLALTWEFHRCDLMILEMTNYSDEKERRIVSGATAPRKTFLHSSDLAICVCAPQ
jgi:hypothetical protein